MLFSTGSGGDLVDVLHLPGRHRRDAALPGPERALQRPQQPQRVELRQPAHRRRTRTRPATLESVPGATSFNVAGWEQIKKTYLARTGPGGVPLDMQVHFILGGSAMEPVFKRMFKRVLVLEDSARADRPPPRRRTSTGPACRTSTRSPASPSCRHGSTRTPAHARQPDGAAVYWTMSATCTPLAASARCWRTAARRPHQGPRHRERVRAPQRQDRVYIKGDMGMNVGAAFPWVFDEWRST